MRPLVPGLHPPGVRVMDLIMLGETNLLCRPFDLSDGWKLFSDGCFMYLGLEPYDDMFFIIGFSGGKLVSTSIPFSLGDIGSGFITVLSHGAVYDEPAP